MLGKGGSGMLDFRQSVKQSELEPWGSLEELGATNITGNPEQSGRVDYGSMDTPVIVGVWECTKGSFQITYPWNEMATILEGHITLTDKSGKCVTYSTGDTHFVSKGESINWQIISGKVRKCFFIYTGDQISPSD